MGGQSLRVLLQPLGGSLPLSGCARMDKLPLLRTTSHGQSAQHTFPEVINSLKDRPPCGAEARAGFSPTSAGLLIYCLGSQGMSPEITFKCFPKTWEISRG